jgi:hypothetical protein
MIRRVLLDRRIRFLVLCVLILMAGISIEFYMIPQAMRHLRVWSPEGRTVGLAWVRLTVTLRLAMAGLRLFADPLHLTPAKWPRGQ